MLIFVSINYLKNGFAILRSADTRDLLPIKVYNVLQLAQKAILQQLSYHAPIKPPSSKQI